MPALCSLWFLIECAEITAFLFVLEHCLAPQKVGKCRGAFPRWYYNPTTMQCEGFIFGGCKPNKNNYLWEEECKLACKNVAGMILLLKGTIIWAEWTSL